MHESMYAHVKAQRSADTSQRQHHNNTRPQINGLVQDCRNSIALAMELL